MRTPSGRYGMLKPKPGQRFLLVTSSFHMPRSIGAFRTAGFEVEAYPVDWRTRGWRDALQPFDRVSGGLSRADVAIHEWTGLIVYWLTGRSSALFPAPRQRRLRQRIGEGQLPAAVSGLSRAAAGRADRRP